MMDLYLELVACLTVIVLWGMTLWRSWDVERILQAFRRKRGN